jgi:hypothetical protein
VVVVVGCVLGLDVVTVEGVAGRVVVLAVSARVPPDEHDAAMSPARMSAESPRID